MELVKNEIMKRKHSDIRKSILKTIKGKDKTINEISKLSKINWKTVQRHLTYLKGMGLIDEVFSSPYARIFKLTELGKEEVK